VDIGPEFICKALDLWAYAQQVELDFIQSGNSTDNALIESFIGRFQQECLNQEWFLSVDDAKRKAATRRMDYNDVRPHCSLGNLAPRKYAEMCQEKTGPGSPKTNIGIGTEKE
jgi:putative transposase